MPARRPAGASPAPRSSPAQNNAGLCHQAGSETPTYTGEGPLPAASTRIWSSRRSTGGPFTGEILARCEEIMRDVCADFGAELREFNGEADHVHLLVHYPPRVALSRLVGSLKGVSARRLRQEFPGHIRRYLWGEHFWSASYFAASCRAAPP